MDGGKTDLDPMMLIAKPELAGLFSDENLTMLYAMVSDATLNDADGQVDVKPEQVASMNQFEAWECIGAMWKLNVRPHLARLQGRAMPQAAPVALQSAPLTTPVSVSASVDSVGGTPASAFQPRVVVKSCGPGCVCGPKH